MSDETQQRDQGDLERALRAGLALADGIAQNATREDLHTLAKNVHRIGIPALKSITDDAIPSSRMFEEELGKRQNELIDAERRNAVDPDKPTTRVEAEKHGAKVEDRTTAQIVMVEGHPYRLGADGVTLRRLVIEDPRPEPKASAAGIGSVAEGGSLPPARVNEDADVVLSIEPGVAVTQESQSTAAANRAKNEARMRDRAAEHRTEKLGAPVPPGTAPGKHASDKVVDRAGKRAEPR